MSAIDEVKQRTDIVEVVSQYASLTKSGRTFRALCPFHSEKHPSFFVYPDQQSWHCFGACNAGGDVFSFIMKKQGIDFGDALRLLAQRAGVTLSSRFGQDAGRDERERLYQMNEAAARYFHDLLLSSPDGEKARNYVASRGFSPKTITDFQLGFSPNSWEALKQHLMETGYTESELLAVGLVVEAETGKTHDRFRNKLMFPIHDLRGRIVGFGSRVLDDSLPKYVNSPQTPVFDKNSSLYGINLAGAAIRQQGMAVIVEGYMDVITAHQNGFNNVVASMGTAVTEKQVGTLKKLAKNTVLALDADAAGEEAMQRGGEIADQPLPEDTAPRYLIPKASEAFLNEAEVRNYIRLGTRVINEDALDVEASVTILPEGKDADDVIKQDAETWRQLLEEALPIGEYTINMVTAKFDLTKDRDANLAAYELMPFLNKIKDTIRLDRYLTKTSNKTGISYDKLEAALAKYKADQRAQEPRREAVAQPQRPLLSRPIEEYCLALLLQHPELKAQSEGLSPEYFENSENREILIAWQQTDDLSTVKDKLEPAIWEHLDSLIRKSLPDNQIEQKYTSCVLRLQEIFLKSLEAKRAAVLALEAEAGGTAAELAKLEEQGIEVSVQLGKVFTQKRRGRSIAKGVEK